MGASGLLSPRGPDIQRQRTERHRPKEKQRSGTETYIESNGKKKSTVGLLARAGCAGCLAEVLVDLACFEGATEEHTVGAGGGLESKLVEGDDLAAGGSDACARSVGATEAADCGEWMCM